LSGGSNLPEDLAELRAAISDGEPLGEAGTPQTTPNGSGSFGPAAGAGTNGHSVVEKKKYERRNIWDGEMDVSKLRIKEDE
jgi:hypothetical protein